MAANKLQLTGLPFEPSSDQVFYIENAYDAEANSFIGRNYAELKAMFRRIGMKFYYLPYLAQEQDIETKVRYYAPYLQPEDIVRRVESNALVQYLTNAEAKADLTPSFIFGASEGEDNGDVEFLYVCLADTDLNAEDAIDQIENLVRTTIETHSTLEDIYRNLLSSSMFDEESDNLSIDECRSLDPPSPSSSEGIESSSLTKSRKGSLKNIRVKASDLVEPQDDIFLHRISFRLNKEQTVEEQISTTEYELTEQESLFKTEQILEDLLKTVQKLKLNGVSLMAIHEFIDKQEPLSRVTITEDYRIFLPDYNNMEIEMGALPKAIYFLFLRYPEGIVYKHIESYREQLLNIYRQLRPKMDDARRRQTIEKVTDPLGNALNENFARIRKAFVEKFDEHLAKNYIIRGESGQPYSITLDRNLITWEE